MSDSASRAGDLACPGCPSRCGGRPGRGCGGRGPPDGGSRRVAGAPGGRGTAVPLREVPDQVWDDVLEQERADVPAVVAALLALRDVLSRSRRRCRRDTGTRIVVGPTSQDSVHQGGATALHSMTASYAQGGRFDGPRFLPEVAVDRPELGLASFRLGALGHGGEIASIHAASSSSASRRRWPGVSVAWPVGVRQARPVVSFHSVEPEAHGSFLPRSSAAERTRWVTRRAPARGVQGGCDLAVAAAGGKI
ncbi:hypothetical protein SAMN05660976_02431 [Nonomuraea pusilla]|uniref:Uncharacterized protein n=1 Tax=Nonomuraea pusilla TaxID=46177 RepID=A0A1H7Q6S4_9ACTN|nr:hypothetical protein SAMN05660976_02431 [Nonomuraea pusilla]